MDTGIRLSSESTPSTADHPICLMNQNGTSAYDGDRIGIIGSTHFVIINDRGIVMFRNLLRAQIQAVQAGNDPVGVNRDPAKDETIRMIPEEAYNAFSFAAARQRQSS